MVFNNNYFFLSTFYPCTIHLTIDGKICSFLNVEAAYQAQKNPAIADKFSDIKGMEAKQFDKTLIITVPDWEHYKVKAMALALHEKYKNRVLLFQLKSIEGEIINDTPWGDTYWGITKGEGKNILGKLLTCIRDSNNDLNILLEYVKDLAKE